MCVFALVLDVCARAIVGRWLRNLGAGQIVWHARKVWLLDRRLWPLRVHNLGTAKVPVARALQIEIVQDAFVVDVLRVTAMLVLQVGAALVQAVGILYELGVTRFLDQPEELQRAIGNFFAFVYTFSGVVELVAAQHKFLR